VKESPERRMTVKNPVAARPLGLGQRLDPALEIGLRRAVRVVVGTGRLGRGARDERALWSRRDHGPLLIRK
jgi:hypothetical protein